MSDHAKQILVDAFGRVRELVINLTDGLTDEIASYRPDQEANSIAWLIWHLSRVQDDHVADVAQVEQVWAEWRERFDLPFGKGTTGYGQGPEEVAAVRVSGELLGQYHGAVHDLTLRYLDGITPAELEPASDRRSKAGERNRRHDAAPGPGCLRTRARGAPGERVASAGCRQSLVSRREDARGH